MKVAYILKYPFECTESFVRNEIMELVRRGNLVLDYPIWEADTKREDVTGFVEEFQLQSVLSWRCWWSNLKELESDPIEYVRILLANRGLVGIRFFIISMWVACDLRERGIDRIHAPFATLTATRARMVSRKIRVPFSCTGLGSDVFVHPPADLSDIVENAVPFIAVSNYMKDYLQKKFKSHRISNLEVLYLGVDTDYFKPSQTESKPDVKPVILSVARLHKVKGLDTLIRACASLKSKNVEYRCVIAGSGDQERKLQELTTKLGLGNEIEFLGHVNHLDIKRLYQMATVFVLPSLSEGIPVAAMEAMSMGVPVVASNITGIPELIDDGVNGYLVQPGQPEQFAGKIHELLTDRKKLEAFGSNGREKVCSKFRLSENVDQLERLFHCSVDEGWDSHAVKKKVYLVDEIFGFDQAS